MVFDASTKPAIYCGNDERLKGNSALVTRQDDEFVVAQFDDLNLGDVAYGWHKFPATDFKLKEVKTAE